MNQIIYNGQIHPTATESTVEAIWIKAGKVAGIGLLEPLLTQAGAGVTYYDLQGKSLFPGFQDPHIHIWKVGDLLTYLLDLRGVRSIVEMQDRLRDFAARNPQRPWILARGFNEALMAEGRMPDRHDLDHAVPDRPCYVIRTCAHIGVLNSVALNLLPDLSPPPGGEVRLDALGNPSGVLTETALGMITRLIPPPTPAAYREMILAAQDALLRKGITSATDPAVMPDLLAVYKALDAAGELKIRINAIPILVPDGGTTALPLPEPYHSDFLNIDTVKLFADGGLSGKTAALFTPYRGGKERGMLRLADDFFLDLAHSAQAAGLRMATHAIGDAAIEQVLRMYAQLDRHKARTLAHRIEHLGLPSEDHLKLMRDLNVSCVSQPIFLYELGPNFRKYLPDVYLQRVYPYRSVLDAGVRLAFSSDAPVVSDFTPLMGIRNAIERVDVQGELIAGEERIELAEALHAYTLGAAQVIGADHTNGDLTMGKWADFIVLDINPFQCSTTALTDINVLESWVGGIKS
ncbi:amidohydrolase [Haliscomenobacter hydrossis]|uniref:Amidohydrolase 3 n=1 Tax=Haliscomenobacter hydrossis (strain ATCC 27775 / DSM 1100 / LMG 10767 / O) TaxID=760192 RepID=F4KZK9_HALH1|nr:amidohydrolase [Haliscomenobacter hydrossis]AEE49479.1 Amidohydrolase 3 [Haliscomenobacter hydrossis DSM 1100]